jgi:D-xylose transport system substrate-binding protein
MDVPAAFLPVESVTEANIAMVVEAGLYTWDEICEGADDSAVCAENM